ncbi:hypothetical protein DPMN_087224, partial [Dreissena polymorpha]
MKHILLLIATVYVTEAATADVLQRHHTSLQSCAKACLAEKDITCRFFKFENTTGTCLLSGRDKPDFSLNGDKKMPGAADVPSNDGEVKTLLQKYKKVQGELDKLKKNTVSKRHIVSLRRQLQKMKGRVNIINLILKKSHGKQMRTMSRLLRSFKRSSKNNRRALRASKNKQKQRIVMIGHLDNNLVRNLQQTVRKQRKKMRKTKAHVRNSIRFLKQKFSRMLKRINKSVKYKSGDRNKQLGMLRKQLQGMKVYRMLRQLKKLLRKQERSGKRLERKLQQLYRKMNMKMKRRFQAERKFGKKIDKKTMQKGFRNLKRIMAKKNPHYKSLKTLLNGHYLFIRGQLQNFMRNLTQSKKHGLSQRHVLVLKKQLRNIKADLKRVHRQLQRMTKLGSKGLVQRQLNQVKARLQQVKRKMLK